MLTLKKVNETLKKLGIEDTLYKGKGYFYFSGACADSFFSSSVLVPRLNDLSLQEWVEEYMSLALQNT